MDLKQYKLKDLLLAAIKSEVESKDIYEKVAKRVKNAVLKGRLDFLASEEKKHKMFIEDIYKSKFGEVPNSLPANSEVPLPSIDVEAETDPISEILKKAMDAELAAKDFYSSLGELLDNQELKRTLEVLANMEYQHYKILESEYENAKKIEDYEDKWDMMHVGP